MTNKKKPDASLKGKKPVNRSKPETKLTRNPGHIANKMKRSEMYGKYLQDKKLQKKQDRKLRDTTAEALGEDVTKRTPRTIDNTREVEPTMVLPDDDEVAADHADDEFASYFSDAQRPKILVTTRPRPSQHVFFFLADLQNLIPALHFYPRKQYSLKEICIFATNRGFTHLMVLGERHKKCNGMTISHLQGGGGGGEASGSQGDHHSMMAGPTAFFKVSNVVTSQKLPQHGTPTSHIPELNLHGFGTRLGHRVGRFLGSLFPHNAEFQGRQVVTFHNQRDFIFVRHHRYIFHEGKAITASVVKNKKKRGNKKDDDESAAAAAAAATPKTRARLQELGPRFTLKMRWLQEGTFDTQFGEYEWFHKRKEMDTTRRRFHL